MKKNLFLILFFLAYCLSVFSKSQSREHLSIDNDWKFSLGHPFDTKKDFNNGTSYFSYLAKAGFGDGPAAANFDDRNWRKVNVPHDWVVELPFAPTGATVSHGCKAVGRNFPDNSVGWYRKKINIPASDKGKHISIIFDGVYRNSIVWINGHYLGTQPSGYLDFEYNITDYINYGGENTIAVRADATMEEGWFYEGAGIYRHVWLNKTHELHIATNGTAITPELANNTAAVKTNTTVLNDSKTEQNFSITQTIIDATGKNVTSIKSENINIGAYKSITVPINLKIDNPNLWDLETPYLYKLLTIIEQQGKTIDNYTSTFGVRTIRFDPNEGFFLNGKHVKIKGTNNHQDHAGVGTALPDALQDFRIKTLKSLGSNAYRCSHNPPTPELLDACDKLGMLVIDENRLFGSSQLHLNDIKRMIERDFNHPSIISWSVANEEWGVENDPVGAAITLSTQAYIKSLDPTRPATAAFSGSIGSNGISSAIDLLGINYIAGRDTDVQHKSYPNQSLWGTEEGSTNATRGAYYRDDEKHIIPAYDKRPNNFFVTIENGWKHYDSRPYLAGMYIWTGFDYRGEPTPYAFPSISSYFGMVDTCGFDKDDAWYLRSWWTNTPTLHLLPHWNWKGKEGQPIEVWAYSNCDEVELFLNKKSQGKKAVEKNGHLEWMVNYTPGTLEAIGYKNGKKQLVETVKTTNIPASIALASDKLTLKSDDNDVAMLKVSSLDKSGLYVPIANNEVTFTITGPGKIIGVGNGDPTSLENDQFIDDYKPIVITGLKEKFVADNNTNEFVADNISTQDWQNAFKDNRNAAFGEKVKAITYRTNFELPNNFQQSNVTLYYRSLGKEQSIYINGKQITNKIPENNTGNTLQLDKSILRSGQNNITIVATPLLKKNDWTDVNKELGIIQLETPAPAWKRKLFNGLAQVIVQTTGEKGTITITATSNGLKQSQITLQSK